MNTKVLYLIKINNFDISHFLIRQSYDTTFCKGEKVGIRTQVVETKDTAPYHYATTTLVTKCGKNLLLIVFMFYIKNKKKGKIKSFL
jgi:hypothetical protein